MSNASDSFTMGSDPMVSNLRIMKHGSRSCCRKLIARRVQGKVRKRSEVIGHETCRTCRSFSRVEHVERVEGESGIICS